MTINIVHYTLHLICHNSTNKNSTVVSYAYLKANLSTNRADAQRRNPDANRFFFLSQDAEEGKRTR